MGSADLGDSVPITQGKHVQLEVDRVQGQALRNSYLSYPGSREYLAKVSEKMDQGELGRRGPAGESGSVVMDAERGREAK